MERILVIAVPGIGDALLATPLVRSLKLAFPNASIDMIVRDGKSIVDSNPDISRILVRKRRPPLWDDVKFLACIFRRYDLAVSTSTTDRAFTYMLFAARTRVGTVASLTPQTWWKRKVARNFVDADPNAHIVSQNLRLADILNINRNWTVVLPEHSSQVHPPSVYHRIVSSTVRYAVIHMKPGSVAREWPVEYWRNIIESLRNRGITVVATGGKSHAERAYVADVLSRWLSRKADQPTVFNLAGALSFCDITRLMQGAAFYIGTDTSTTHVAAATGIPTVALFGPTDIVRWGPWPRGFQGGSSPYRSDELSQTVGNVTVLQQACACGSIRRPCTIAPGMPGSCMTQILPDRVMTVVDGILQSPDAIAG
ncbi:MAG: glycosyltransferase family 9 protein [Woeseia sp.]